MRSPLQRDSKSRTDAQPACPLAHGRSSLCNLLFLRTGGLSRSFSFSYGFPPGRGSHRVSRGARNRWKDTECYRTVTKGRRVLLQRARARGRHCVLAQASRRICPAIIMSHTRERPGAARNAGDFVTREAYVCARARVSTANSRRRGELGQRRATTVTHNDARTELSARVRAESCESRARAREYRS